MTKPTIPDASKLDAMRRALAPAAVGALSFGVEGDGAGGALVHVFGAYDCKGTEAEVAGLLKNYPVPWRIVWH